MQSSRQSRLTLTGPPLVNLTPKHISLNHNIWTGKMARQVKVLATQVWEAEFKPRSHVKPDVEAHMCTCAEIFGGDENPWKLTSGIFRGNSKRQTLFQTFTCMLWHASPPPPTTHHREIKIKHLKIPSLAFRRFMSIWKYNYTVHLQSSHSLYSSNLFKSPSLKYLRWKQTQLSPCKIGRKIIYLESAMALRKPFHSQRRK